jgi:hypothetical protein
VYVCGRDISTPQRPQHRAQVCDSAPAGGGVAVAREDTQLSFAAGKGSVDPGERAETHQWNARDLSAIHVLVARTLMQTSSLSLPCRRVPGDHAPRCAKSQGRVTGASLPGY